MTKRFDAPPPSSKVCKKCGIRKLIKEFSKDAGMQDNYKNTCKACVRAYNKKYIKENAREINMKRRRKYNQ